MPTLRIAEFPGLAQTGQSDSVAILPVPPTIEQSVVVSASGVISSAFQATTKFVELCTDTTCSVFFGLYSALTTASVTTGNGRINANERVIRRVPNTDQASGPGSVAVPQNAYGLVVIIST